MNESAGRKVVVAITVHNIIIEAARDLYPKLANKNIAETDWSTGYGWFQQLADRIVDDMDARGIFDG